LTGELRDRDKPEEIDNPTVTVFSGMGDTGTETTPKSSGKTTVASTVGAESGALLQDYRDPNVAIVVQAWPNLSLHTRELSSAWLAMRPIRPIVAAAIPTQPRIGRQTFRFGLVEIFICSVLKSGKKRVPPSH
jgi:hypothetical protein